MNLRRLLQRRLSARIVALSLGLLLAVQAAGYIAISATLERQARGSLAKELEVGERVGQRLLAQRAATLAQGSAVLASDYGFRSAVGSGDTATIASALENSAGRIGAGVAAWVGTGGEVLAAWADGGGPTDAAALARAARALQAAAPGSGVVETLGGRPVQFVAAPVRAPLWIGSVLMGFVLDEALARDLKKLSGLEVLLPAAGVSTLPPGLRAEPEGADRARLVGAAEAAAAGEAMALRRAALAPGAEAWLMRSLDEALAPLRRLQRWLLGITLGGVLVFALGSLWTARRVTTPLSDLVDASERLGRGDFSTPMEHAERADEIGNLAKAFDAMRLGIAARQLEIQRLAYWDRLTGLPNRAQFRDRLQQAIDAGAPCAVLMFDLDRFKRINDVLGYAFGDRLLKAVADRVSGSAVREADLLARLSGDEFALLLAGAGPLPAQSVAERLADGFELPMVIGEQVVDVSAAFGVACWPLHGSEADTLLSRAEVAMHAAKRRTERVRLYDPSIDVGSAETLSLLSELRRALERGELRLWLQPKIDVASGLLVGAEALVRWQHPQRGLVPPVQFIPFAEETGFVRQLTLWVFEAACREWPMLERLGLERVSVNLSARDLMDPELPARLDTILRRHRVGAEAFCLEVTESFIMDDPGRAEATLAALSAAGFKLSIDDFGTGYSSQSYLMRLPVDELKIDQSFVRAMPKDRKVPKIVRSMVDLGHSLGLTVVAEGVESAELLAQLAAMGCDEAQGYHVSRPVPAAELAAFAAAWTERCQPADAAALLAR